MTEHQLKEFLEANKADIQETVKRKAIDTLLEQHRWDIGGQISAVVNEFVANEIIPSIKEELASQKHGILAACISSLSYISDNLATALVEQAAKNTKDEWKRREIAKAIFGY